MARTVRELDEEKFRDCKEDIDTLLVFVSKRHGIALYHLTVLNILGRAILRRNICLRVCVIR